MTHKANPRVAERRIIIFTRCPDPGQCKTRLIPALGIAGATAIHEVLLQHTVSWARGTIEQGTDVEVHYAGNAVERLRLLCGETDIQFKPQAGANLGQRLANACASAFHDGCRKLIIVGSDCPDLSLPIIRQALDLLDHAEVVIGPAIDGGYYLIGLCRPATQLFQGIAWGEPTVLDTTLQIAKTMELVVRLLPSLADIDCPGDLWRTTGIPLRSCERLINATDI